MLTTGKSWLQVDQLDPNIVNGLFEHVQNELFLFPRPTVIVRGTEYHQNRDVGFFSNTVREYYYSRKSFPAQPCSDRLRAILQFVNQGYFQQNVNMYFNALLINRYQDGSDNIGAHSDDESNLYLPSGIASLSLGASRKFRLRCKKIDCKPEWFQGQNYYDLILHHGMLIRMSGHFQSEFTHEIPKELTVKESRISLTFRRHL